MKYDEIDQRLKGIDNRLYGIDGALALNKEEHLDIHSKINENKESADDRFDKLDKKLLEKT
jgi:hypothetical protein